jgi:hypothetical protein
MIWRLSHSRLFILFFLASLTGSQAAELYLNEILFNPPGPDINTEYIEIRGTPNYVLPEGTWFVAVEGDTNGNPGRVQNTFNLSHRLIGQNGFLVLLQKFTRYKPHPYCVALTNIGTGDGWGNGSSSSLRHRGENGQTELENPSATFFLIQTLNDPEIDDDIDTNNDSIPDGPIFAGWTILDSIGVIDSDGVEDTAYGRINFRRDPGNAAPRPLPGITVTIPFSADYIGRNGNSAGWTAADWVASDNLQGKSPKWKLGINSRLGTNTYPAARSGSLLGHIGAPNFAAPTLPSVIIREIGGDTSVIKGGKPDSYLVNLATAPLGPVTVQAEAAAPLQISVDGKTFSNRVEVVLASVASRKIFVRVANDGAVGPSLAHPKIHHSISTTSDAANYPLSALILDVVVTVTDPGVVRLTEAKVNPPGTNDGPFEYIELIGPPDKSITNLYVLAVQGNAGNYPGTTDLAIDLSGQRFGSNGHLLLAAPGHPNQFNTNSAVLNVAELAQPSGALDNGTLSLLLVGSWESIPQGVDLDSGDNGTLEGLPEDAVIMDAVAWKDGDNDDVIYGPVELTQKGFTPDAVSRLPGHLEPNSAAAWMAGDLAGTDGESLMFDATHSSTNVPPGTFLTPGFVNATAPMVSTLHPVSHVIGDAGNPVVEFTVSDDETPATSLQVSVTSTNQEVIPDSNLVLVKGNAGAWTLQLTAVGVGYSDIIITVFDGTYTGIGVLHFAASLPGRPGGIWHTGISDASTAIPIDSKWMFVGDDENQTLRIYSRVESGGPVAAINFNPFLGLVDFYDDNPSTPKEVDIEASTRVGRRIFWLGSHSHSADTLERTNRARLFATDSVGTGTNTLLTFVGRYDYLKLDLLDWDQNNEHGKGTNYYGFAASGAVGVDPKSPDGSGFNLEGLCMAPGSTTEAYIAFRAPLIPPERAKALLIPVTNFTTLAAQGGPPGSARFGLPIELNLGGRGIRSIEGIGTNYLIVAGPPGAGSYLPPPGNFKLFTWSGQPDEPPQERTADLSNLNVEGIVEVPTGVWTPATKFQLVSDGGTNVYYGDDIPAKQLRVREFKKFRTDTMALGSIATQAGFVRSSRASRESLNIEWFTQEGAVYRLQSRASLSEPWKDYGSTFRATGAVTATAVPLSQRQCFFRIVALPR